MSLHCRLFFCLTLLGPLLGGCLRPKPLALRRVVLYQNGIGYFERQGTFRGQRLRLRLRRHELNDVLKTLTVIDRSKQGKDRAGPVTAIVPKQEPPPDPGKDKQTAPEDEAVYLDIALGHAGSHDLLIAYSAPTPAWKATYRLVLPRSRPTGKGRALLQGWALVNNASGEDWAGVRLTLATGAPMTFAMDMHTPRFVARPDLTGAMVKPVIRGPVRSESARPGDRDGDGIGDAVDKCPADPEDRDGFQDSDGCPDPDNDSDRIPDKDDKCPDDAEVYNGQEDGDGCPDRGRVVVHKSHITILDKIYFARGAATIKPASRPIIGAIAVTLKGNPDVRAVEVQGHASPAEADGWGLSARRAGAVRAALLSLGVTTDLRARAYGGTMPIAAGAGEERQSRNRRVEFIVLERGSGQPPVGPVTATAVRDVARDKVTPTTVAGMVRYQLPGAVSIGEGTTTMVTMINRDTEGRDIQLYRPDSNVPGSRRHPQRAAMIENRSKLTLEAGPVAIFARGTFVGEGLLRRLHPDETAYIPYAVDSSTSVRVTTQSDARPSRLISVADGVFTVEDHDERVTRYEVEPGVESPDLLVIRHPRRSSFEALDLPPRTRKTAEAYLIPVPIRASRRSELAVRERRPVRRTLHLSDGEGAGRLSLYLEQGGGALSEKDRKRVERLIKVQRRTAKLREAVDRLRGRVTDVGVRGGELRENIKAVAKTRGGAALKSTLLKRIAENVARMEKLTQALARKTLELGRSRDQLSRLIRKLRIGGEKGK
jgi:outer membrane protein OmpA-like peptidoglycan-associated protein